MAADRGRDHRGHGVAGALVDGSDYLGQGNGGPANAQFGQTITPNQHVLARRFGTFDNFYDEGTLSADGHNWIVQAAANDYVEKQSGRSTAPTRPRAATRWPTSAGFRWNAAQRAGVGVQDFGEYANFFDVPSSADQWGQWYKDSQILEGKASGSLRLPIPTSRR